MQRNHVTTAHRLHVGEGGAGTFSDGKLTSRTKNITREKNFIIDSYINAGAPEEIRYLAHPHLGSDNLKKIVRNLRKIFVNLDGIVKSRIQTAKKKAPPIS